MPSNFDQPWPVRDDVRIRAVQAIVTAPQGIPLVVVKVDTTEPGLYGLGCATFTQRWKAVQTFVDEHLARLLIGRYPGDIGDLTRLAGFSGYWRGGPVTNNAISGVDQALWDIAGKRAGMPVYELLGGKVRAAARHLPARRGRTIEETLDHAQKLVVAGAAAHPVADLDAGRRRVRRSRRTDALPGLAVPRRLVGARLSAGRRRSCSPRPGTCCRTTSSCCTTCTRG